jgi:hypothetical protein
VDAMNYRWITVFIIGVVLWIYVIGSAGISINTKAMPTPVNITENKTTTTTAQATTKPVQKTYIVYYFTMAAPCPEGVKMNKDINAWAPNHKNVEFHFLSTEAKEAASFNVRLSPTTILIDKSSGKVVKEWVGVFDLSELTAATK